MTEFIEFLKKHTVIPHLMNIYDINLIKEEERNIFKRILEGLQDNNQAQKLRGNVDLVGMLYESYIPQVERKLLGQFYTPFQVVDYILNSISYNYTESIENKKLIDISCGSGSFIIRAINRLVKKLIKSYNIDNISEINFKDAKIVILQIKESITGIDINPIACILCQINIIFSLLDLIKIIYEQEEDYELPIFDIHNLSTLEFNFSEKYDYVVGNPPYVFIRDIPLEERKLIETGDFDTNKGQYDYYQLFIEIGIKILKNQGFLGYIVPDSLLALSNRDIIRKYIYDSTKIKEIIHAGSQFEDPVVSSVILILQKEILQGVREENLIKIPKFNSISKLNTQILQKKVKEWDYKFLINLSQKDTDILEYLNSKFPKLKDLMIDPRFEIVISRGVELGKDGRIIYCDNCKQYYPLPKSKLQCIKCSNDFNVNAIEQIVVDEIPQELEENYKPYLFSLNRYQVKERKYIDITKEGINYKDISLYINRIVVRQLSQDNLICATFDENSITSQSFYNLKIIHSQLPEFNNFYLLGLLNSLLLSYYFIKSFGSYKKLFPRILIEKLKTLPMKIPESEKEMDISKIIEDDVRRVLNSDTLKKEEIIRLQNKIDLNVFNLFQISKSNQDYISKSILDK